MYLLSALVVSSPILVAFTTARNILPSPVDNPISYILGQQEDDALSGLVNRAVGARCGPDFGKCPNGHCCSTAGYCGNTKNHCRSPDCQINYGHCDAHKTPGGAPTESIPRPQLGHVAYGPHAVRSCSVPGTVALTYDDGPGPYTKDLLDLLDKYDAKATFFITGNNNGKGEIDAPGKPWIELIQRMRHKGHQIASHTWSHQDLSKISRDQRRVQLLWNEVALRNILGAFPTYMRPPYSSCTPESGCLKDMGSLGYHVVLYDIDTEDYRYDSPTMIQHSKDIFDRDLARGKPSDTSWLVIAHDVHEQTVHNLTEHMLKKLRSDGYRPVTVGECLGDTADFWYRKDTTFDKDLLLRMPSGVRKGKIVSRDGVCGNGITCAGSAFGPCCSKTNRCGNYSSNCGEGCQPDFGKCSGIRESDKHHHKHPHHELSDMGRNALKSEASSWYGGGPVFVGLNLVLVVLVLLI
ncbi:chitin deacetylase CDA6 [Aspergillus melleus]|uniref:chitin deacetylase CDA6 n=1 Tax=Aspergillus melleus TaxID=138277 RepID=UPI001E8CD2EA|nr:uncharacterized protein LDX57_002743 [Aspergillus melleus]KAH8424997.1 hypothetical protein LDX57_002743 [Aspergillus melleus]